MNPDLNKLQAYPFEKLAELKQTVKAPTQLSHIALSIGEPKHAPPAFVLELLKNHLHEISKYPSTKGIDELRQAIASWLGTRFQLKSIDFNKHILPVNGTREALFAFAQSLFDRNNTRKTKVLMPNPFYQIYEGAAYLAGAEPHFLNCSEAHHFIPDYESVDESTWKACQLLYICTPGNPGGTVTSLQQLCKLIELADKYDFVIASDECYSELYPDENNPPPGLLQACAQMGRDDFSRCMVFHSLSKRSNLPGLRSGFVAGDSNLIKGFLQYRTYHG
jgi:N-succinyldiaminopimelate aminotransferase